MPELFYNLELTDDELNILWAALTIIDNGPGKRGADSRQRQLDRALKTALSKVQRLMEGH